MRSPQDLKFHVGNSYSLISVKSSQTIPSDGSAHTFKFQLKGDLFTSLLVA